MTNTTTTINPRTFFRDYVEPGVPAVLRGFARDWPAVRVWSLPAMAEQCKDTPVRVQMMVRGSPPRERVTTMPFDRAIRLMQSPGDAHATYYIQQIAVPSRLRPSLGSTEGFVGPRSPLGRRLLQDEQRLWAGPSGTVTPLHIDLSHNFFVQLVGRKRFMLLDPSHHGAVGFPDYRLAKLRRSALDLERPDYARYPSMRDAKIKVVELGPGDALFLPHSWWHQVRSLEASVSLSHWWITPAMLFEQREYWYHRARRRMLRARSALPLRNAQA